jgi:hypothetical protein
VTGGIAWSRPWSSILPLRETLALATLTVAVLTSAARADAFLYWTNYDTDDVGRRALLPLPLELVARIVGVVLDLQEGHARQGLAASIAGAGVAIPPDRPDVLAGKGRAGD